MYHWRLLALVSWKVVKPYILCVVELNRAIKSIERVGGFSAIWNPFDLQFPVADLDRRSTIQSQT